MYLGDGWVLTDVHVGDGRTIFNNVGYNEIPGSAVQLANPAGAGFTPSTDLLLFRIADPPDLPSLSISSSAPAAGWQVTMIGDGRDRSNSQEAYWTSNWQPSSSPAAFAGDIWAATNSIHWGTNVISGIGISEGISSNSETAFATTFGQPGSPYEATGAPGDSGGAVFHKDAQGNWDLAGVMFAINTAPGQPWGTSVIGNATYSADLSVYRSEIYHAMALPGDLNFDGVVNGLDLSLISSDWGKAGSGASNLSGDANHDGAVNGLDLALVVNNWSRALSDSGTSATAVPEPASIILAAFGALALLAYRRRERQCLNADRSVCRFSKQSKSRQDT